MNNPIRGIGPEQIDRSYHDRKLARLSDAKLLDLVIEIVERPKVQTTSYSLHIGMETLARFRLLTRIPGERQREGARKQMVAMASAYERLGPEVPAPQLPDAVDAPAHHLRRLIEAIKTGYVRDADTHATILGRIATSEQIAGPFADATLHYLGAAGHAGIFLSLAMRAGVSVPSLRMLPAVARGLAAEVEHQVGLGDAPVESAVAADDATIRAAFYQAVLSAPRIGAPSSGDISAQVEHAMAHDVPAQAMSRAWGLATGELSSFRWYAAMSGLVGAAARLMIDEVEDDAKYYWSHCLTIPQGTWALGPVLGDRWHALRVASVMALGFRSSRGRNEVDGELQLEPRSGSLSEALGVSSREAAAVAFHAPVESIPALREQLALEASLRNDAHLVKYVLACLDCAAMDHARAPLFHAAAAYLSSVWAREIPPDRLSEQLHTPNRAAF